MNNWLYNKIEDALVRLKVLKFQRDEFFRVLDDGPGLLPVEILKGTYKGTKYTITGIHVLDDYGHSKYDVELLKVIPGKHIATFYGDAFYKLVGEILAVCLNEAQHNRIAIRNEVLSDEVDSVDYCEKPAPERTIPP